MAEPNQLNPQFEQFGLNTGVMFYSGTGTSEAAIQALVGSINLIVPSFYYSIWGSGQMWVLQSTDHAGTIKHWYRLTIN